MLLGAGSAGFSLCKVLCVRDRADVPRTFCNPVFVPTTDSDGNDVAGICLPDIAVPLATYSGWNVRAASFAGADLCDAFGQKIDFAQTRAERLAAGDPRLSIEERYPNHGAYVSAVAQAANGLHQQRFLLDEDVEQIIDTAAESSIGK